MRGTPIRARPGSPLNSVRALWLSLEHLLVGTGGLLSAGIDRVRQKPGRNSVHAQYTVFVENRQACQAALQEAGIPTAVHYPIPLNEQPAYREAARGGPTPLSAAAARRVLSLPMSADIAPEVQHRIVQSLRAALR